MNDQELSQTLEAILFTVGGAQSRAELLRTLKVSPDELERAVALLQSRDGGIVLVDDGSHLELRTAGKAAPLVEAIQKEAYARELGKAGLETLSAILYKGPLSRSEIDFIRGVNSSQILRTLTMRGLVRKRSNPKDERSFVYEPTTELLGKLGIRRITDLPEYEATRARLQALEDAYRQAEQASN